MQSVEQEGGVVEEVGGCAHGIALVRPLADLALAQQWNNEEEEEGFVSFYAWTRILLHH